MANTGQHQVKMISNSLRFETAALSDTGKVRSLNEDRYLSEPHTGIWAVADGMGGHDAGEVASSAIVDSLATIGTPISAIDQQARFFDRLLKANTNILQHAAMLNKGVIGSTLVSLLAWGNEYRCVWSGDSRAYLVRRDGIVQISKDHTEVQGLIDQGMLTPAEAATYARRNVITRAIGISERPEVDMVEGEIQVGDAFILCSDGLTGHVSDNEIFAAVVGRKAETSCRLLIDLVLERGATDNVTVVIVQARDSDATIPLGVDHA